MSDFVSDFWSIWITAIVVVGIAGLCLLLLTQSKTTIKPGQEVETMGHVWDDNLEEYNNPLPKWWMWMFVLTLVFGVVYLVLYPGLGTFKGIRGWTSVGQYKSERAEAEAKYQHCTMPTSSRISRLLPPIPRLMKWGSACFRPTACNATVQMPGEPRASRI